MTDSDLLHRYASEGSEEAFSTLVDHYSNLVFSAALRQTGDPHSAEEVAQVVFIILARKAAKLPRETALPSWLWRTTRFVALNSARKEQNRRKTEREAVSFYHTETEAAWIGLAPRLDEALSKLAQKDRNAVILRFFEKKTFREIGQGLGTSEDGAHKRVTRAIDKLRTTLLKQGVVLTTAVLAGAISSKAVQPAPAGISDALARGALVGGAPVASIADKVLQMLDLVRKRAIVLKAASVAFLALVAWLLIRFYSPSASTPQVRNTPPPLPLPAQTTPAVAANLAQVQQNLAQIHLQVLDAQTQRPVPNAQLSVYWSTGFPNSFTNSQTTDQEGRADVGYDPNAEDSWSLLAVILKPGFVPEFVSWAAARGDLIEEMPSAYSVLLEHGTVVGGIVTDPEGQPIPGACVQVADRGPNITVIAPAEREGRALAHLEITDLQGRWTCDHVPAQLDSLLFTFSHSDYLQACYGCAKLGATKSSAMSYVAEWDLRQQTALVRLQRGCVIGGLVTDTEGKPLGGATVIKNRQWRDPTSSHASDAQGRFRFGDVSPGDLLLTARAEGFVESDLAVHANGTNENLRFKVAPAGILRGRIVDSNGVAIARAVITATGENYQDDKRDWDTLTDSEGRFQWLSAPSWQTNFDIRATGFKATKRILIADGTEHPIVLQQAIKKKHWRVAGRVVDSKSLKPIEQFQVWVATTLAPGGPSGYPARVGLAPELKTTGTNGGFSFLEMGLYLDTVEALEIELRADGYLPVKKAIPGPITNRVWIEFALDPAPVLSGTVELPDGRAATGAVVILAEPNLNKRGYMQMPGQFDLQLSSAPHALTDQQGSFSLPSKSLAGLLIAAHPDGFVQLDLAQASSHPVLQLRPWGKVTGVLRLGDGPATNKDVFLGNDYDSSDTPSPYLLARTALTDPDGNFVFEGVPPGDWRLEPHHVRISVRAGETTTIKLGGGGVRVEGTVRVAGLTNPSDLKLLKVALNTKWFTVPIPKRDQFSSFQEYSSAKNHWWTEQLTFRKSPAGRLARTDLRAYFAKVLPDGSFVFEEVLPGIYECSIGGDPLRFNPLQMSLLQDATADVTVPEPENRKAAAIDVGVVEIDLTKR